jgi:hypothetical protein
MWQQVQVKIDRRGLKHRSVFFNQIVAVFEGWNDSRNNGARALTDSRGQVCWTLWNYLQFQVTVHDSFLNFEFSSWMPMLLLLHRVLSTKPALLSNGRRSFFPRRCCFPLNFSLQGDVILIDNLTVMHSRQTFVPPRRTLAR